MEPAWHPLSALLLSEPRAFVTSAVLRRLLGRGGQAELIYAGDRMWPTVKHGQSVVAQPLSPGGPARGSVVIVCPEGIPELARVLCVEPGGVRVVCDGDPSPPALVGPDQLLAVAGPPGAAAGPARRALRRLAIELREAVAGAPDPAPDAADTVQWKYDAQAPFYAKRNTFHLPEPLADALRRAAPKGSRMVVAGSGAGGECFALEEQGWAVTGLDFAASMVELSRRESQRRGSSVVFLQADLRSHREPEASVSAILFTYNVYSFLPDRSARIELLRRMRRWLAPGGILLLSARRIRSAYERVVLTAQWLARRLRGGTGAGSEGAWGDSHTRWITSEGALRRSFLHCFGDRGLEREVRDAGFHAGAWEGGHCILTLRP